MTKLLAVTLLTCIAACGQTGTKPHSEVSDAFAKISVHVLIAMRDSSVSNVDVAHVKTLLEDMEIEQSTPVEKLLKHYFCERYALSLAHQINSNNFSAQLRTTALKHDRACFDAYIVLLKANDGKTDFGNDIPSECKLP